MSALHFKKKNLEKLVFHLFRVVLLIVNFAKGFLNLTKTSGKAFNFNVILKYIFYGLVASWCQVIFGPRRFGDIIGFFK